MEVNWSLSGLEILWGEGEAGAWQFGGDPPPPPQKPCEATVLLHDVVLVPQQQAYQSEVVWVGVSPELSSTLEWTPSSLEQGAGRGHQLHRQTENTLQHA